VKGILRADLKRDNIGAAPCIMFSMQNLTPTVGSVKKRRLFDPHETPRLEALAGLPLAAFWQRALAFFIDFLIVLFFFVPVELARQYITLKLAHGDLSHHNYKIVYDPRELVDLVYFIVYSGLMLWATNGLTAGKRLLRIRVISLTNPKISFWQAFERGLGYGASFLEGGFGFIQFFIHPNRQCVHDRIAETIVVLESRPARDS
jgi:uncharacterized RDD family membrane protein YckC